MANPKLPEGLEPVAWQYVSEDPLDGGQLMLSEERPNRRAVWPLVRLSDAQAALQALAAEHAAEIRRIRDIRNENAEDCRTEIRLCLEEIAALKEDAARYRWLRDGKNPGNRYPHLTQYPYQPDLDKVRIPQMVVDGRLRPENIDAAIDSALLAAKEAKQ